MVPINRKGVDAQRDSWEKAVKKSYCALRPRVYFNLCNLSSIFLFLFLLHVTLSFVFSFLFSHYYYERTCVLENMFPG